MKKSLCIMKIVPIVILIKILISMLINENIIIIKLFIKTKDIEINIIIIYIKK